MDRADIEESVRAATDGDSSLIAGADEFLHARILARPDGFFILELNFKSKTNVNFSDDLDELALLVCMVAKQKLGHIHYWHAAPERARKQLLSPDVALKVHPIHIPASEWGKWFEGNDLKTDALRNGLCVLPKRAPSDAKPRLALVALRRSFLKAADAVTGMLHSHRQSESDNSKSIFPLLLSYLISGALVAFAHFVIFRIPNALLSEIMPVEFVIFILLGLPLVPLWQLFRWDLPRIRLIRQAQGFFVSANLLNQAISRIKIETGPPPRKVENIGDFSDLIDDFDIRMQGELHRVAMKQFVSGLIIAVAGVLFAVIQLRPPSSAAAAPAVQAAPAGLPAAPAGTAKQLTPPSPSPGANAPLANAESGTAAPAVAGTAVR